MQKQRISAEIEEYLRSHCNRIGLLVCIPDRMSDLADDVIARDRFIRDVWAEHGTRLTAKWEREFPGMRPVVLDYLAQGAAE